MDFIASRVSFTQNQIDKTLEAVDMTAADKLREVVDRMITKDNRHAYTIDNILKYWKSKYDTGVYVKNSDSCEFYMELPRLPWMNRFINREVNKHNKSSRRKITEEQKNSARCFFYPYYKYFCGDRTGLIFYAAVIEPGELIPIQVPDDLEKFESAVLKKKKRKIRC